MDRRDARRGCADRITQHLPSPAPHTWRCHSLPGAVTQLDVAAFELVSR